MNLIINNDTPFDIHLSFDKIIEDLEKEAANPANENSFSSQKMLNELSAYPQLKNGITDPEQLIENAGLISRLLKDYFSPVFLSHPGSSPQKLLN